MTLLETPNGRFEGFGVVLGTLGWGVECAILPLGVKVSQSTRFHNEQHKAVVLLHLNLPLHKGKCGSVTEEVMHLTRDG